MALAAAAELLGERGYARFTVDEVSRRSGVSKATMYRHWNNGFALAVEAFGSLVTDSVPVATDGDVLVGLRDQVVRLAAFYATPAGRIAAELVGGAVGRADGDQLVRERFFGPRRDASRLLVRRGQHDGAVRDDLSPDLVIDLLFGAVVFRMFSGLGPLRPAEALALADAAVAAIAVGGHTAGPSRG